MKVEAVSFSDTWWCQTWCWHVCFPCVSSKPQSQLELRPKKTLQTIMKFRWGWTLPSGATHRSYPFISLKIELKEDGHGTHSPNRVPQWNNLLRFFDSFRKWIAVKEVCMTFFQVRVKSSFCNSACSKIRNPSN